MVQDRSRLYDGFLTAEGGVDAGFAPSLIQPNQLAWAVNATVRGGFPRTRPGWWKRTLSFPDQDTQDDFEDGLFQGAGTYTSDSGISYLAVSISGRIYLINLSQGFTVQDITIPGNPSSATEKSAWFVQAENFLIVQNGLDLPFLYNGSSSRRANSGGLGGAAKEVPIGGPMAYGKGRLWVAYKSQYVGGDLVWSDPVAGRESVIRFTENTFLNEGGAFTVANGPITGLAFGANLDTSLGDGDLSVFTSSASYAFSAPVNREEWKDLQYPIQRFALLNNGALSQNSIVTVNGDLFFRSLDGVRSMIYARRDFTEWGNTPISRQVTRAVAYDTPQWLYASSAVSFDNRLLMTVQPQNLNNRGVYHRGLVVLDFYLVSGMGRKQPPAWEGVWTGQRILQIVTTRVGRDDKCFMFVLGEGDAISIVEVTKDGRFDFDGEDDVPTEWILETRSVIFGDPLGQKRLMSGEQWYDDVAGDVTATVRYRSNESACWATWAQWTDCAEYRNCEPGYPCQIIQYLKPAARSRRALPQPPDQNDPQTGQFTRIGYEFQVRYELTGRLRIKRLALVGERMQEPQYGDMTGQACVTPPVVDCQTGCLALECPGSCSEQPADYAYQF
jgi:hypothetical protein